MIDIYVNDIKTSLKNKCYFSALSLALTLPDICGMAEFPDKTVSERYIGWYDEHICITNFGNPYLSGEIVYNLRNTYLHQGSANIDVSKVKAEINQIDKFILYLGDGSEIYEASLLMHTDKAAIMTILVDITWLCEILCEKALTYYEENKDKFRFDFNFIQRGNLHESLGQLQEAIIGELAGKHIVHSDTTVDSSVCISESRHYTTGETSTRDNKREQQIRSFFGQNFKEKKYKEKKEQIIQAVLTSKTKMQLNNQLQKLFLGADVKIILHRLKPQIADLH